MFPGQMFIWQKHSLMMSNKCMKNLIHPYLYLILNFVERQLKNYNNETFLKVFPARKHFN